MAVHDLFANLERGEVEWRRLNELVPICPICRRPVSERPLGAVGAASRLAAHIVGNHDRTHANLLVLMLTAELREPVADPFYPTGERW